ncbi:MAG: hypothetical protein AAB531_00315 [Patescibacteria group bacterium]
MKKIASSISFAKHNFIKYQAFTLFSILILGALFLLSHLPYFSIFLSVDNIINIYWIIVVLIFWPPVKFSFVLGIIFSLLACFFLILSQDAIAERSGNIIYFLIVTGFLQTLINHLRKESS